MQQKRNKPLRSNLRGIILATTVVLTIGQSAEALTTPAPGYLYSRDVLSQLTEGCIAKAPGGVFVGVGPALSFPASGGTREIRFVSDSGSERTVATGLNSIGDCVYDAAADVLYVTDSGLEFAGATTGDTVFAIPGASSSVAVAGLELLPSGSIPYVFGIDLSANGLLVSDAAGPGLGSVIAVDQSGMTPVMSTFATGFAYTGGLVVDGARVIISEAHAFFDSSIHAYSAAGVFQSTISGPTYDHGSADLALGSNGSILASGSPTLVSVAANATVTPLVTGLDGGTGFDAYGGGIAVDAFTGRIDFLASSFSGADDDKSLHHLVPVDRLVAGGGSRRSDCIMEFYGVELVASSPGRPARSAICVDGAACDADGVADGGCTFPIGLCFNVSDTRLGECVPSAVASVELVSANPNTLDVTALMDSVSAALPSAASSCVFGEGVRVSLRDGTETGRGTLRLLATTDDASPRKDADVVRLVCEPAL